MADVGTEFADYCKCDEAQPSCRKCKLFGVSCNYARLETSLDLDAQGSFQVDLSSVTAQELYHPEVAEVELIPLPQGMSVDKWLPPLDRLSNHSSLAVHVNESLRFDILGSSWSYRSWHFSEDQLQIISRFRERTSVTIGNPQMAPLYRDLVCRLACKVRSSPYLRRKSWSIIVNHTPARFPHAYAPQHNANARCPPRKPLSSCHRH
jgi:hypothetical protein